MEVVVLALVMVMATAVGGSFAQETAQLQLQLLHVRMRLLQWDQAALRRRRRAVANLVAPGLLATGSGMPGAGRNTAAAPLQSLQ